jgi:hypothetical protein
MSKMTRHAKTPVKRKVLIIGKPPTPQIKSSPMTSQLKAKDRPEHYDKPVSPWELERHMESTGNTFVDARRTDAIEYAFRLKGDLQGDLKKAIHCLQAALEVAEEEGL